MTVTNANKTMVDLPYFELCSLSPQAPFGASNIPVASMCTAEDGSHRYIYYLTNNVNGATSFYRYDCYRDVWQVLAPPTTNAITRPAMRFTKNRGFHGRIISATSTSITIPGLRAGVFNGAKLRIEYGPGDGEEKTLTFVSDNIHDAGIVSSASTTALADSTKKWKVNQWAGYTVAITMGSAAVQYRKILYNNETTLTVYDANLLPHDSWNNSPYASVGVFINIAPANTAGVQTTYQIMSTTYNVDSPWVETPTRASFFTTLTGGIYLLSATSSAPFFMLQYYDVVHDVWAYKTCPQGLLSAALGTDFTLERTGKFDVALSSNQGTISATSRTLTDAGQSLTFDRYANHRLYITGGTGVGQSRRIVAHNATTFTFPRDWTVTPDNTSTYEIWPDYDRLYFGGGAAAALYAYSPEFDWCMQGQMFDSGITNNIAVRYGDWQPLGVTSGTRIAAGVRAINSTPTAGGTNYAIGDVLTCAVGGTGAQVRVTSIDPGGIVTGLELVHSGITTGYTTGTGRATTGGTGTGCTIEITEVGPTALITTPSAHWFEIGQSVTFSGCSEAAWNAPYTIIGVPSTTTFCVSTSATATMAATTSQSSTIISDPTKNWIPNEHVGRLVHLCVAGQSPTAQIRWITANTATTLTVATITAGANGLSKYVIYDAKPFGADDQFKEPERRGWGYATGGSATTLVDNTKNWIPNQWAGYLFKIEAGTGYGSGRISIISNTATTLTFASQSFVPDTTTKYEIADTWGLITTGAAQSLTEATTKNWRTNQWGARRVRITGGTGLGQEFTVSSNTSNSLTFSAAGTATDTTSTYAILSIPARSTGIELVWVYGGSDANKKARYIWYPRGGGSNGFDIYDISTGRWDVGTFISPGGEGFNTGSSYTYDGNNTIYAARSLGIGTPLRILAIDINSQKLDGAYQTAQLSSTIHIGNFLEIVDSPDGVSYLYTMHHSTQLMSRAMIF